MLSQYIHVTGQKPRDIQIHGFSSGALDDPSPNLISDGLPVLEQKVTVHSALADAGYSSPSSSQNDIRIGSSGGSVISHSEQKNVHLSSQNYILKEFKSFLAAEWPVSGDQFCPNKLWVGSGFISGFDLTISLTEIKVSNLIIFIGIHQNSLKAIQGNTFSIHSWLLTRIKKEEKGK